MYCMQNTPHTLKDGLLLQCPLIHWFSETHTHNCTQAIQNLQRTLDSAAMKYGHEKGWK